MSSRYQFMVKDALGIHVIKGEMVAHVSRTGSTIRITRRKVKDTRVTTAAFGYKIEEVQFEDTERWAHASNCVRVEQP